MNSLLTKYGRTVGEKQKEKKQFTSNPLSLLNFCSGLMMCIRMCKRMGKRHRGA